MRTLAKNKVKMQYALLLGETPIYALDENGEKIVDWTDDDGTIYYQETGEYEPVYSTPQEFLSNISMSGNDAEAKEYGLSTADYEAVLVFDNDSVPLVEGALIWHTSVVESKYVEETELEIGDKKVSTTAPIVVSADFSVIKISRSLNFTKAILKAVNK